MANKKKRNKRYQGVDAVQTPAAIKVTAPDRSKLGQWFHENYRTITIRGMQLGVALIVGGAIYYIFF